MKLESDNLNRPPPSLDDNLEPTSQAGVFLIVFGMLIALTGLSFWIANSHLMENRPVAWGAMMAVSVAKAMLVVMVFMHLWWERAWKYVMTVPALIMGCLLVMLMVPDVGMRTHHYSKQRTLNAPVATPQSLEIRRIHSTVSNKTIRSQTNFHPF